MKRSVRIIMGLAVLLLIAGSALTVYLLRVTGDQGTSALERWIGDQLQSVAGAYLNATLTFENPDYQYPLTVVVEDVRLTAADPSGGGGATLDIIAIKRATLTLAEIPSEGQPLKIERVALENPQFRFTCKSADDISLIGFSDLVKKDVGAAEPAATEPSVKVTDVFQIRTVHILNGQVFYNPRRVDRREMMLDRINMAMNIQPDAEGWYTIGTKLDRQPIGSLEIAGRYNLNDNVFDFSRLAMSVDLGAEGGKTLPPQMQQFLAEHEVRGELDVTASGTISINDWRSAKINLAVNLSDGRFTFGKYRLDVQQLSALATMSDRLAKLTKLDARLLGGSLFGTAELKLNETLDASLRLEGDGLRLEQLARQKTETDGAAAPGAGTTRGVVKVRADANVPLTALTSKLTGGGHIRLSEGRLVDIPIVVVIEKFIAKRIRSDSLAAASDEALVMFTFRNDRVRIDRLDYRSNAVAVRGGGDVMLDGKLNLIVNGGPIEKVQSLLGPVGDLTALLTDRIAKYHITGVVGAPVVKAVIADGIFDQIFGN